MDIKLTQDAIQAIRDNGTLYGAVSEELDVKPGSLVRILKENDKRLTQAGVVALIKKHKPELKDKEILSKVPNTETQAA